MKEALKARGGCSNWLEHLPWALMGLQAAPNEDSGVSSAEVLYGAPLILPGQVQQQPEVIPARAPSPATLLNALPLRQHSYAEAVRGSSLLEGAGFVQCACLLGSGRHIACWHLQQSLQGVEEGEEGGTTSAEQPPRVGFG